LNSVDPRSTLSSNDAGRAGRSRRPVIVVAHVARKAVAVIGAIFAIAILTATQLGCGHDAPPIVVRAACSDGRDNDRDGVTDFAGGDRGCTSASDRAERDGAGRGVRGRGGGGRPACSDGRDNDGDGLTDFVGHDPGCTSDSDPAEKQ
jgi:hypothetical protein